MFYSTILFTKISCCTLYYTATEDPHSNPVVSGTLYSYYITIRTNLIQKHQMNQLDQMNIKNNKISYKEEAWLAYFPSLKYVFRVSLKLLEYFTNSFFWCSSACKAQNNFLLMISPIPHRLNYWSRDKTSQEKKRVGGNASNLFSYFYLAMDNI